MFDLFKTSMGLSNLNISIIIAVLIVNIFLFFFSKKILNFLYHDNEDSIKQKLKISRIFNILFPVLIIIDIFFKNILGNYNGIINNIIISLGILYLFVFIQSFISFFVRKEFGKTKEIDDKILHIENYSTRIFNTIITTSIIGIIGYSFINIWELNSLLSNTGLIYVISAFMALTNQIWAPDLYYGIIMLKSDLINDGDIIKFKNGNNEYIINKILFNHTILSNVRTNSKMLIRNSELYNSKIENLTKIAYPEGLRFSFTYKIGYPNFAETKREEEVSKFLIKIRNMFEEAHKNAYSIKNSKIKDNSCDVLLKQAGDFALEFEFFFFVKPLPNTKLTKVGREYLVKTPLLMNEEIYKMSIIKRIDLSTPDVLDIKNLNNLNNL